MEEIQKIESEMEHTAQFEQNRNEMCVYTATIRMLRIQIICLWKALKSHKFESEEEKYIEMGMKSELHSCRNSLAGMVGMEGLCTFENELHITIDSCKDQLEIHKYVQQGYSLYKYKEKLALDQQSVMHELLLDASFQLDEHKLQSFTIVQVQKMQKEASWEIMRSDLQFGVYEKAIREAKKHCKQIATLFKMLQLEKYQGAIFPPTDGECDNHGTQSWPNAMALVQVMIRSMIWLQRKSKLGSASETECKWHLLLTENTNTCNSEQEIDFFVAALRFVDETMRQIRIAWLNKTMKESASSFQEKTKEIEKKEVEQKLKRTPALLQSMLQWLQRYSSELPIQAEELCFKATLDLVTRDEAITSAKCPATLLYDLHHIVTYKRIFFYDILHATFIMLCQTCKMGNVVQELDEWLCDFVPTYNNYDDIAKEVQENMQRAFQLQGIKTVFEKATDKNNAIYKIMRAKVLAVWALNKDDTKMPLACQKIAKRGSESATRLKRLVQTNFEVHKRVYTLLCQYITRVW